MCVFATTFGNERREAVSICAVFFWVALEVLKQQLSTNTADSDKKKIKKTDILMNNSMMTTTIMMYMQPMILFSIDDQRYWTWQP